jgi:crossover junction endodeoxyribonuclease RuvC
VKIIGIDPGLSGALALLETTNGDTTLIDVIDVPVAGSGAKQSLDAILMQTWLLQHELRCAYLERAQVLPKQGSSSGFKYGRVVGAIEATLAICAVPMVIVEPSRWKRHFHLQGADKEGARQLAIRLFPREHRFFARRKDHNHAEAVLIGLFGIQSTLQIKPNVVRPPAAEVVG